jgi:acyl-CoA thioesterase-1
MPTHRKPLSVLTFLLAIVLVGAPLARAADDKPAPAKKPAARPAARKPSPSLTPIQDVAGLPRVLLIGDSISMGYTLPVRKLLEGKANVHRIPTNGGPTTNGIAHLKEWLGDSKWDVIHFNWGLHDLKFMPEGNRQVSPEDYEKNLSELVKQLKATGATLIWCTTTPVPEGVTGVRRDVGDVAIYNDIALRIMKQNHVAIDDLNEFAAGQIDKIQLPKNVHFSTEGSDVLAQQVATSIEAALPKK